MGFRVQRRQCASCIYRADSRLDVLQLEAQVKDAHGFFSGHRQCHHSSDANPCCCRGFWDRHKDEFAVGQVAQRLGMVEFVEEDVLA